MLLALALQSANIFALRSLNRNIVKLKLQSSQTLLVRNGHLDYKQGEQLFVFDAKVTKALVGAF